MRENDNRFPSGSPLNTLVQSETTGLSEQDVKPPIMVYGNGSELNNEKAMKGRAKRKTITQKMILSLVDVSKNKGQNEWTKAYWNTYHCQSKVISSGGKLYGTYCKNRFCTLCCAIRKADIMNKYLPVIKQWEDPYFVTLTVRAVPAWKLNKWVKLGLVRGFRLIVAKFRKRNQRGKGIRLIGVKSLECNFNPKSKTYNPHFHIIVPSKQIAETLINEWLLLWTKVHTSRSAQHMRRVEDKERDLIEIVKYGSKIFTEPDVNKKSRQEGNRGIHTAALDNIFHAMKGCRIFERFGFDIPKLHRQEGRLVTTLNNYSEWLFDPKLSDWVSTDDKQTLTGYSPAAELIILLSENIDNQLV